MFNNRQKGLAWKILPGVFEELSYNKFYSICADDKTKTTDLCIFDIYDNIIGCCREAPKVSPQNDGFVLVLVGSSDHATPNEKLMIQ